MYKQIFTLPKRQTTKVIYRNARIIDPETRTDFVGDLVTESGKIVDFARNLVPQDTSNIEVIDCTNMLICPGLLDIQVHFREPGQEYKEDLITGTMSAVAGGVTTAVCMANTDPVIDIPDLVASFNSKAKKHAYSNLLTYASITKGLKGETITEMRLLKDAGAIGFSDDGKPVMNSLVMCKAMEYASQLDVPIIATR